MPKPKPKSSDVAAWASAVKKKKTSTCQTCARYSHLLEAIREYDRDYAPLGYSQREFLRTFLRPRGYKLAETALRSHLTKCVRNVQA